MTIMLLSYAMEQRSAWWVLMFSLACAVSSLYGWRALTWPFGVVEECGHWSLYNVGGSDSYNEVATV
jgi:hypothetical protein